MPKNQNDNLHAQTRADETILEGEGRRLKKIQGRPQSDIDTSDDDEESSTPTVDAADVLVEDRFEDTMVQTQQQQASTNNVDPALSSPKDVTIPIVVAPIPIPANLGTSSTLLVADPPSSTFLLRPRALTQIEPAKTTNVAFAEITIQKLLAKIKENQTATSPSFTFAEVPGNPKEATLTPPAGTGAPVKIKEVNNEVQCSFTGVEGMKESAKVLLEAFIASRQTELTIGGSDPNMVSILAKLVAEKLDIHSELKVNLDPAARTTLAADPANAELIKKLDDTQPKLGGPKPPTARP